MQVWWAREELNLRPLPCQIQRASTGLYIRWLKIGKDRSSTAAERGCQRPTAPTVHHGPRRVVLIPTAVGCCPSAARRTDPDLRDHNLIRWLAWRDRPEPETGRPAVPCCS
jgi:hypothetical protein